MGIDLRPSNKARTDDQQRVLLDHFVRNFPASIADERTVRVPQRPEFAEHGILKPVSN